LTSGTLIFDIETHSAELMWSMPPEQFVRLIGYKWAESNEVVLTTDLEEIREAIRSADWIIGHNIHSFDLPAVFGVMSNEPLELAMQKRVYDTWTHAVLVNPAPNMYYNRFGKKALADSPDKMKSWFSLDEQAFQLGVKGKTHDLKALAHEFGSKHFPTLDKQEQIRRGFGLIPIDDSRYRDYLKGDVRASEVISRALLDLGSLNRYAMREQELEARKFVITENGWRVNIAKAKARRDQLAARKAVVLKDLQDRYGLPTEGASPWATSEGKDAIFAALADYGITPKTVEWPKTAAYANIEKKLQKIREKIAKMRNEVNQWKSEIDSQELTPRSVATRGRWIDKHEAKIKELKENPLPENYGLSLSGDALISLTEGTDAEEMGQAIAELKGQRSLSQLTLDTVFPDGFVHPQITMLQRSGRWSTTEPGLTVWTNNGPGAIEKDYYEADTDDELLIEFDYNNADGRVVAAYSGDRKYAERFEEGADGHMINALAAWGQSKVDEAPKMFRQKAKALGHGWNFGGGPRGLSFASGLPLEDAKQFCDGMAKEYFVLVGWQDEVRQEARQTGYVVNDWGRRMPVDPDRVYTQAPALIGQSGTREVVSDALLRMDIDLLRRVKAQIHDALVVSVPKDKVEEYRRRFTEAMECTFSPKRKGSQPIHFPVSSGPAARSWYEAIH